MSGAEETSERQEDDRPFTAEERKHLRELLTADQRRQWLVSVIKTVALWVAAVGAGVVTFKEFVRSVIHPGVP